MTAHQYSRELAVAEELALQAAQILRGYHGTGLAVQGKAGGEPVTLADIEASQLIVAGLRAAFPDDHVLSEEAPDEPSERIAAKRVWMVDPMDGTRDFIQGRDGFSVMIGLCESHKPVLGVVHQPIGEVTYLAALGEQPIGQIRRNGSTSQLVCSSVSDAAATRLVASRSHRDETIDRVRAALGTRDELNVGSVGLKLGLIARGDRDLYVNPGSLSSLWDVCAPQAILEAAGGTLTDLYGDPLRYDAVQLKNNRGLLASNGKLHSVALEKLAFMFPRPA